MTKTVFPCLLLAMAAFFGAASGATANDKVVVGYWHNWQDAAAPFIRLKDVADYYNVICIAFAESSSPSDMNMVFAPDPTLESDADFTADVKTLQAQGKKVLISVGGENGYVDLTSPSEKQKFLTSMDAIIKKYGFNGIDLDLEGGCVHLGSGDTDFHKPASPLLVNLIDAVRTLWTQNGGASFWVTAAPEIAYVQGGIDAFTGIWGAYLPVLFGLGDMLTYVHVQYYNSGSNDALDGKLYNQGSADFIVAMTEMLVAGFNLGGSTANSFPGFKESQVAFGLPSVPRAASGGFVPIAEVQKALDYLTQGKSYGGAYVLRKPGGYPGLRGIMTWSINWDAANGYQFGKAFHAYLNIASSSSAIGKGPASGSYFTRRKAGIILDAASSPSETILMINGSRVQGAEKRHQPFPLIIGPAP